MKCACSILTGILNSLYNSFDRREKGTSAETSAQRLETLQFAADSTSGNKCLSPYNTEPIGTESFIKQPRSPSNVGNTIMHCDRKQIRNKVLRDRNLDNFSKNQDIIIKEDSVPDIDIYLL